MVFYLKYRPKKISELDSIAIQEKLTSVLKGKLPDKIPHAFLFTGPKGLGKTSTARIVAKSINCTNRNKDEVEPCNKCSSCKSITTGASLDVLEIDGASNRGIDEIRDLREKIRLAPVSSFKKIYIIDEVHMLTTEAFNALLKTLEEPPSHAQFILCTTEAHKLPETITSRCFNIRFTRATIEDLVHSFERIVKAEGIVADKQVLEQIAALSDGSFRDGAKILEEVSAGGKKITANAIEKNYNFGNVSKSTQDLILALMAKDSKKGIRIISKLSAEDTDFKYFNEQLLDELHKRLIEGIETGSEDVNTIKELIEVLIESYSNFNYAALPELPLELAVVEWCSGDSSEKSDQGIEAEVTVKSEIKTNPEKSVSKKTNKNDTILESLINNVGKDNFSIAGVLRGCSVESFDGKSLVISTGFNFHKEKLSDKKVIEMLENNLKEIEGNDIEVSVVLRG